MKKEKKAEREKFAKADRRVRSYMRVFMPGCEHVLHRSEIQVEQYAEQYATLYVWRCGRCWLSWSLTEGDLTDAL